MRKSVLAIPLLSLWAVLALADPPPTPAPDSDSSDTVKMVGNWQVDCSKESCLILLYYTNGAGDNTTVVKLNKTTMKPDNFAFMIVGPVDEKKGFVVQFAKTLVDDKNQKCSGGPDAVRPADCYTKKLLDDEVFNGPFSQCDDKGCFARVGGQYIGDEGTPGRIDLLEQYENDDDVFVLWADKSGKLQRVALDIDGFKKAYDAALSMLKG